MPHDVATDANARGFEHMIRSNPEDWTAIDHTGREQPGFGLASSTLGHVHTISASSRFSTLFPQLGQNSAFSVDRGLEWRTRKRATQETQTGSTVLRAIEIPCYAAAMPAKPRIAIVGPGRLGTALALELSRAGYPISEIISRRDSVSARTLAATVGARAASILQAQLDADVIWFCVPDGQIARAARQFESATTWRGKTTFHSSGALASDVLNQLRKRGASAASVHPLMTFVSKSAPSLEGVPFGIEGDKKAARLAERIVRDLGGEVLEISKQSKAAYHAWGTFASPLLIAALVTAERVAAAAGISRVNVRRHMLPIVRQTVENYGNLGPAAAFSGPLVRGDVATIRTHLRVLKKVPEARDAYLALARAALRHLPAENRRTLNKVLG